MLGLQQKEASLPRFLGRAVRGRARTLTKEKSCWNSLRTASMVRGCSAGVAGGARPRLHVDEGEQLLEQLAHEERGAVVGAQRGQQPVQHRQDVAPMRAQLAGGR